jgi:hypothetical protein
MVNLLFASSRERTAAPAVGVAAFDGATSIVFAAEHEIFSLILIGSEDGELHSRSRYGALEVCLAD